MWGHQESCHEEGGHGAFPQAKTGKHVAARAEAQSLDAAQATRVGNPVAEPAEDWGLQTGPCLTPQASSGHVSVFREGGTESQLPRGKTGPLCEGWIGGGGVMRQGDRQVFCNNPGEMQ